MLSVDKHGRAHRGDAVATDSNRKINQKHIIA